MSHPQCAAVRSWRATLAFPGALGYAVGGIFFLYATLVASLDEWHQSYLPSRTGTWHDVVLDSTAALIAQILLYILLDHEDQACPTTRLPHKFEMNL